MTKEKIGFIGLGHMGLPMMLNLVKAGYELQVFDVVSSAMQAAEAAGAKPAKSVAELAKNNDVIITSVQTSQQVEDLCLGERGIFANAKPGLLYIDCSSIDISKTRECHEAAKEHQVLMLDAPVSGGVAAAKAGTLTIMVGGDEEAVAKAQPILACMGKKVIHAGTAGNGQAAKICNNLLLAISMVGTSEAFSLAQKLGLDPKKFFEISSNASGQCWSMTSYCPVPNIIDNVPANRNYQPGFMAKMMLKDLRLAHHAAESCDAIIPLGALTTELYELFVTEGGAETDFSGIIKMLGGAK